MNCKIKFHQTKIMKLTIEINDYTEMATDLDFNHLHNEFLTLELVKM